MTTPGRQVVGNPGPELTFDPATDVLVIDPAVFGVSQIFFANGLTSALPSSAST